MFAISTDKELNTLSEIHYRHEFDKNNIYRIRFSDDSNQTERYDIQDNYRSNWLFGKNVTYAKLASILAKNARIKVTNLTDSYTYQDYKATNKQFVPLYTIDDKGFISIINEENSVPTNCRIVALVAEQ